MPAAARSSLTRGSMALADCKTASLTDTRRGVVHSTREIWDPALTRRAMAGEAVGALPPQVEPEMLVVEPGPRLLPEEVGQEKARARKLTLTQSELS